MEPYGHFVVCSHRDRDVIIQVGSALAYRAIPLQSSCAKHVVKGFTESLRSEMVHEGSQVHITMVHLPGFNSTQFGWIKNRLPHEPQPVPLMYQPEVMKGSIVWSANHDRPELWVGMLTDRTIVG